MSYDVNAIIVNDDPVSKSDLIRLHLLRKYGGYWVDATLFCHQSLDSWAASIEEVETAPTHILIPNGIEVNNIRLVLSTWFLGSIPNSKLFRKWEEECIRYWKPYTHSAAPSLSSTSLSPWDSPGLRTGTHEYFWLNLVLHAMLKWEIAPKAEVEIGAELMDLRGIVSESFLFLKKQIQKRYK